MEKEANKWAETEDEVLAAVDTSTMKHAHSIQIFLCKNWKDLTNKERTLALVHELVHTLHREVDNFSEGFVFDNYDISISRQRMAREEYSVAIERMVDKVSRLLANHVPLYPGKRVPVGCRIVVEGDHT
jgi:hypothetical protein